MSVLPSDIYDCEETDHADSIIEVVKSPISTDTWAAFDLIDTMSLHSGSWSFDGLPMWVVAVDGKYIEPTLSDVVPIFNGQRYRVIVKLTEPGDYTMRFSSTAIIQILFGVGTLRYTDPNTPNPGKKGVPFIDEIGRNTTADVTFFNTSTAKNFPSTSVEGVVVAQTFIMDMHHGYRGYEWTLNNTVFDMELFNMDPPLMLEPRPEFIGNVFTTKYGTWVDIVFAVTTPGQPPHPMHIHSTKYYVIGQGDGFFNWSTVAEAAAERPELFNFKDPISRDTQVTPATTTGPAWLAIRRRVENPGIPLSLSLS